MSPRVIISMNNGDVHVAIGYADNIAAEINAARGGGELIALEADHIPTGQRFYVDPKEVSSVRRDPHQ